MVDHYKVKGQKSKGGKIKSAQKILEGQLGINNLYVDVLYQVLQEYLADAFFVEGCRVSDFEAKDKDTGKMLPEAALVAKFYYSPELELTGDIDLTCENPVRQPEDDAWVDRCTELQHKHKRTEDYPGPSLDANNLEVLIDLIVSDDKYTLRRKWIAMANLPSSLQTDIKQHAVGDLFETKYQVPTQGKPTELDAHIKVYEAHTLVMPDVDDELAKLEEFESLEMLKAQFQVDFDEYTERARKNVAFGHMVNQIIANSKVPHIPEVIIDRQMQERLAEHLARCGKDAKKAMAVVGVTTQDKMEEKFRAVVIQEMLSGIAARKYAQLYDLPVKEQTLVDHMVNEIEWVDKEEVKDEA